MATLLTAAAFLLFAGAARAEERPIRIPLPSANVNLDPTGVQDVSSLLVARQLNCQLVRMKGRDAVAEAAEQVRFVTPTILRMTLSSAAVFTDGAPVRARDVVATFELLNTSRLVLRNVFAWIKDVKAVDDRTVEFRLRQPYPSFLKFLGAPNYAIVPAAFIAKAKTKPELWRAPVGCGRYKIKQGRETAGLIELEPVHGGRPIVFELYGGRSASNVDPAFVDVIDATFADAIDQVPAGFREEGVFDPRQMYLALNVGVPPWNDRRKRCALMSRVDRKPIVAGYHGRAELPVSFFPRGVLGFSADWEASAVAAAAEPLKRPFTLAFLEVSVPPDRRKPFEDAVREAAGGTLKTTVIHDAKRFGDEFRETGSDALVVGLKSNYLDGYEFLLMLSEPVADVTGYRNPALRRRVVESQKINDSSQRAQVYREIAEEIHKECLLLPLASILRRRVLVRASVALPGFGEVPINEYDLSQAR